MAAPKKPTAKQIFNKTRPVNSKNVVVYFDRAFRVKATDNFDGYMKKLEGKRGVFVRHPDHGSDIFAIPYAPTMDYSTMKGVESSLRYALRSRGLEIISVADLAS